MRSRLALLLCLAGGTSCGVRSELTTYRETEDGVRRAGTTGRTIDRGVADDGVMSAGDSTSQNCTCDPRDCPAGYAPLPDADGCCQQCELSAECVEQRESYAEFRRRTVVEQTTDPCETADDCIVFYDRTGCGSSCGIVIPRYARRGIDDRLYLYQGTSCDPQCPPPDEPCPPTPEPACAQGRCQ